MDFQRTPIRQKVKDCGNRFTENTGLFWKINCLSIVYLGQIEMVQIEQLA